MAARLFECQWTPMDAIASEARSDAFTFSSPAIKSSPDMLLLAAGVANFSVFQCERRTQRDTSKFTILVWFRIWPYYEGLLIQW